MRLSIPILKSSEYIRLVTDRALCNQTAVTVYIHMYNKLYLPFADFCALTLSSRGCGYVLQAIDLILVPTGDCNWEFRVTPSIERKKMYYPYTRS